MMGEFNELEGLVKAQLVAYDHATQARVLSDWRVLFEGITDHVADVTWLTAKLAPHMQALVKVFAASQFVSSHCVRQPGLLVELINSNDLFSRYATGHYLTTLRRQLHDLHTEPQLHKKLRMFRNREMVRIAWRDIAGYGDLQETMAELSSLADACISETLTLLQKWLQLDLGEPQGVDGKSQQLTVLAMGKLGAAELNFSSDVDLIFVYPGPGKTMGGQRSLSNGEFFSRLARQFIRALNEVTSDGFVFRVDMRLRPFGESGPLVGSVEAMENYYQTHGREWERYAMIKARVLTGNPETNTEITTLLRPFVFRRYLDYGVYDSLRDMKHRIVVEVARKGMDNNIKLGAGGIREIEFIGQVFQLIRGGRQPALRQKQILTVLAVLQKDDLLPGFVVNDLTQAYVFLRNTEHRLQQFNDQQTHQLPSDKQGQHLLALSMGVESWDIFQQQLDNHRKHVRDYFDQVFEAPQIKPASNLVKDKVRQLWLAVLIDEEAVEVLTQLGYSNAIDALAQLKSLQCLASYRGLTTLGKSRMDALMPLLIAAVAHYANAHVVLKRVLKVIQSIYRRTSYLALLVENPMALSQLVKLCAASPWVAQQLGYHPLLLDELLDPRALYHPPLRNELEQDIRQRLANVDSGDLEQEMDALRHFKQTNVLRVAAADVSGAVPLMVVSDHLTYIAEAVIQATLALAWAHLTARHGRPRKKRSTDISTLDDELSAQSGFAVIAYGKLGGIELSYDSDLDLVFLYDADPNGLTDGAKAVSNAVFYSRLGQRIIHVLTTLTPAGDLYEVDMRLRPSGGSGLLVTYVDSFEDYQEKKAWTWEHQALVRARAVAGDRQVIKRFDMLRHQVLSRVRDYGALRKDIIEMRERMRKERIRVDETNAQTDDVHGRDRGGKYSFDLKQGRGGIADIEFMVQYMVLRWSVHYDNMLTYTDNIRILSAITGNKLMSAEKSTALSDIYRMYRSKVHHLALQEQEAVVDATQFAKQRDTIIAIWQKYMIDVQDAADIWGMDT
ncbi:MAG: bifunctional [glutamate--ammonia ligase]-adenylyl-L-tyrosine phosphorylase/[glutamate--ammonia-ligase] adenylyltransferase [Gammaproteobacteria bacterium]|nr:bifunctional [glutamate--ammonia ligase]-adenylyl-L-tyrosine phosphorylase/[glutamate--ammonia-ligase] adenylyltransferase [Gammaproteobacteria bacterium]